MKKNSSTFALLVGAVCIASGCRLGDAARPADSHAPTWVMREFMISHWGFPKDEERLQQFLADSFNTVIAVPDELPYCREHGLKALLAEAGDRAAEFVDDPVVWGFFVLDDEPHANGNRGEGAGLDFNRSPEKHPSTDSTEPPAGCDKRGG
ncbi:MAG: hypothetical protein IH897_09495 [Planctomycetes bacterium]|nr:hypothetical protein [Planctomycetota bacterium]